MKVIANEILAKYSPNGKGFEYQDSLRIKLYQIVKNQNNSRSPKAKLARQKDTSQQLQTNLRQAELMNLQRSKAYLDVIRRVREILSSGAIDEISKIKLTNLMADHNDIYSHLLSSSCTIGTDGTLRVIKETSGDE